MININSKNSSFRKTFNQIDVEFLDADYFYTYEISDSSHLLLKYLMKLNFKIDNEL